MSNKRTPVDIDSIIQDTRTNGEKIGDSVSREVLKERAGGVPLKAVKGTTRAAWAKEKREYVTALALDASPWAFAQLEHIARTSKQEKMVIMACEKILLYAMGRPASYVVDKAQQKPSIVLNLISGDGTKTINVPNVPAFTPYEEQEEDDENDAEEDC